MKEFDMYIKWIRKQFPDSMNKEQFYKIAHISKAKARWLLQTGLVPAAIRGEKPADVKVGTIKKLWKKPCCFMKGKETRIPKNEMETLARCFLPAIQAFFESNEGRKEFEEWKKEREETNRQNKDNAE